ncbi:MAG TPA: Lrp/AsnC ligand binding domain-containing protein [Candidatus Nanoarchaeia archaeon]|nr:Lrp/AsnC ligand binding domain-containing protein [Candidatus Nanoarchaeia archaeon]
MIKAYVLIEVEGIESNKVAKELTQLEEVENINLVNGDYDLISLVKAKNVIDLKELALEKIGKVKGVNRTNTFIIAD